MLSWPLLLLSVCIAAALFTAGLRSTIPPPEAVAHMPDTSPISVLGRSPAYNRFKLAVEIQDACNPSGVAHELVRVIQDAMRGQKCTGTGWVCSDPAVVAVIEKLSNLAGRDAFEAHRLCSEAIKERSAS